MAKMYFAGVDVGTSSVKTAIFDEGGNMLSLASKAYDFDTDKPGYAEQDPNIWWDAVIDTIRKSLAKLGKNSSLVKAVGLSGQMHGLVPLDKNGTSIRKAILHCDTRANDIVHQIVASNKDKEIRNIVFNPIFPGFQMVSLCWMREHEPDLYEKISICLCPKDYIRYKLTGQLGTESTDASATLLYDMQRETWSKQVFRNLRLDISLVPKVIHNSCEIAGEILPDVSQLTGLPKGTLVVYGGADQAMHSLGNGIYKPGIMMANIGTSGQVVTLSDCCVKNPEFNTHLFRHVSDHSWYGMAAVLYAGSTFNWFRKNFAPENSFVELSQMAANVKPCCDGLVFFPCMGGERTPYLDPETRGMFSGISMLHKKCHFARAIMEGVAFAMKTCINKMNELYGRSERLVCAGGGVKGLTWAQIQADIYGRDVYISEIPEQACLGAAIVAAVGCNAFPNLMEACTNMAPKTDRVLSPNLDNMKRYDEFYEKVYVHLYEQNYASFHNMGLLSS